jgi:hypothetical protein
VGSDILAPPILQITSNGTTNPSICSNASASLSATCTGSTVKWYDASGTVLQGTGSPFTTPNLTANTTYKVRCESTVCESPFVDVTVFQITTRLYVNKNATGANNGTSWANGFTDLQSALNISCPIVTEIWVAKGIYKPVVANGDRNLSFSLRDNLKLYGGFGGTEALLSDRNYSLMHTANLTTLSGDLNGNDGIDFANNTENSNNVVKMEFISNTARLDGFTISGGNNNMGAATSGGGIYSLASNATIANCNISGNSANNKGGGVGNFYGDLTFESCNFVGNKSLQFGGALFNASYSNTTPTVNLRNCTFINNATPGGTGTFIYNDVRNGTSGLNVNFIHCSVTGNVGNYGIRSFAGSSVNTITISATNSIFHNNWGSLTFDAVAPVNATNCLFDGATANYVGSNNLTTFISPFVSSTDLRLFCGSAAADSGTNLGIPATDKDGNPRPFPGTGVDIGAYELQGGSASVPTGISVSPDDICSGTIVTLTANCTSGLPKWYDQLTGGNLLGNGNTLSKSPSTNITYYVACANVCQTSIRLPTPVIVVANAVATLNLTSDFNANSTQIANTTISATNKIINPAKVVYKAGNAVMLNQGFEATSGSTFLAQIGGCENAIPGLVAYYPFNGNANDESENNYNGVIDGATLTTDKFGSAQKALNFDGNDFVRIPNLYNASTQPLDDVTYSLWFKPNQNYGAADFYSLIIRSTDAGFTDMIGKPDFFSAENNKFQFYMFNGDFVRNKATTIDFVANQWYHVVATRDNTTTKIYLNAVKEGEVTYANPSIFYPDLYLGGHSTFNRWYFNGALDDLRIYNRALSEAEIQAIYNAEKP